MPVIPSFSSYAPVPRLAESYLGARRIEQAERENLRATELGWARVGQQAASDLAQIQVAKEKIAADQVQTQMRLQAEQQQLERNLLQDQQEANIKNAYDQIRLGLDERKVKSDEAIAAMRLQEAARGFTQQQSYERGRLARIAAGMNERQASEESMRESGIGLPGFASVVDESQSRAPRTYSAVAGEEMTGTPVRLPMTGPEFQSWLPTAPPELRTNAVNQAISQMIGPGVSVPQNVTSTNAVPTVTTKAQFDALPSGTEYIGKNGKRYRKP